MVRHQLRHGRQQLAERHHHLVGGLAVRTGGIADRLADVLVEQLDRAFGKTVHRRVGVASQRKQVPERQSELQQPERRAYELDVRRRVALHAVDGTPQPDALTLHGLDQGGGHAAAVGELLERQELIVAVRATSGRDGGGQIGVGGPELAAHDAADRREREAFPLQRADLADPVGVLRAVPRDTTLTGRGREQSEGLVVADGIDGNVAGGGELLDPVPHDHPLYECSLVRSTP